MSKVPQKESEQLYFKFKEHPGDLFRDASVQKLPDPYKEQEEFWIWFHPCFQISQDVCELNDLYKILHCGEFDEESKQNDWYAYYSSLSAEEIEAAIREYEDMITTDCFANFYHLLRTGQIEIVEEQ